MGKRDWVGSDLHESKNDKKSMSAAVKTDDRGHTPGPGESRRRHDGSGSQTRKSGRRVRGSFGTGRWRLRGDSGRDGVLGRGDWGNERVFCGDQSGSTCWKGQSRQLRDVIRKGKA